jgi:hypothetical protein
VDLKIYLYTNRKTGARHVALKPWSTEEKVKWPRSWTEEVIDHRSTAEVVNTANPA